MAMFFVGLGEIRKKNDKVVKLIKLAAVPTDFQVSFYIRNSNFRSTPDWQESGDICPYGFHSPCCRSFCAIHYLFGLSRLYNTLQATLNCTSQTQKTVQIWMKTTFPI